MVVDLPARHLLHTIPGAFLSPPPLPLPPDSHVDYTELLLETMHPSLTSLPIRRSRGSDLEEDTFDDDLGDWAVLDNYDLFNLPDVPDSVTDMLAHPVGGMDLSPVGYQHYNLPVERLGPVASYQNFSSADYSPAMRDRQWANGSASGPRNVFQFVSDNANDTRLPGGPASITPAASLPLFQVNPDTGLPLTQSPQSPIFTGVNYKHRWACSTCHNQISFTLEKDLKRHMSTVHATGQESAYYCRCGKRGVRKDNHIRHVGTCKKTGPSLPQYACKCSMTYVDKKKYIDHVRHCACLLEG